MNDAALDFDVIIVGAGIAGGALACALGGSALQVAVIEAQQVSAQWPDQDDTVAGFDARVSALTVASQNFLQRLDVWPAICERRVSPYLHMHVWDADGTGSIDFTAEEINQPVLGHIVENRLTVTALIQRLQQHNNVQLIAGAKITELQTLAVNGEATESNSQQGFKQLTLEDGRTLTAPLVVAADGANSWVRSQENFSMREWDYGHSAIVTTVETSKPHADTAWQRFLPEGPLAFLPLLTSAGNKQFCSIVWSAVPQYAENLMALDDREFAQSLGRAFEHRLGDILRVNRRFSFPLRQRHASDYVKPGVALIGDAAHTVHPLAGQGINLGLADVQVLAEELLRAADRQLSPGALEVLQRYQRRRKGANLAMMAGMEGFKRLFEHSALPVRWARNSGMRWLNHSAPLKHKIMRQAMGL